ncbi:MAG: hypothetical protein LUG64_06040 [Clostridiales bacterium]|nr:hypothetical protein [Clostridiales bacterium]
MTKPCVLFSPIGNTDPCRLQKDKTMRDGAMLHIIRYYHPEVVTLFLTREMMKHHKKDDRYRKAIHAVCPDLKDKDIRICDHGEIVDANQFELFDQFFRRELEKLHKQYPNHELLVNVTSGTPQMEASLYVLAVTLPFPIKLIQVNSPYKSNWPDCFGPVEDALAKLAESELSTPELDRSREVPPQNLTKSMQKENIKALLKNYDYQAAYSILKQAPELFSDQAFHLCRSAMYRMRMETDLAYRYAIKGHCEKLFTLHGQEELEEIYEYILTLDILLKRGAYADYARAVSPAITAVMEPVVSRCLGYPVHALCKQDEKRVWHIQPDLVQARDEALFQYMNASYRNCFRPSPLSADNLLNMLRYYHDHIDPDFFVYDFEDLRDFESNIRNLAAHTIAAITEGKIIQDCGKTPRDYLTLLCGQFDRLCPSRPPGTITAR